MKITLADQICIVPGIQQVVGFFGGLYDLIKTVQYLVKIQFSKSVINDLATSHPDLKQRTIRQLSLEKELEKENKVLKKHIKGMKINLVRFIPVVGSIFSIHRCVMGKRQIRVNPETELTRRVTYLAGRTPRRGGIKRPGQVHGSPTLNSLGNQPQAVRFNVAFKPTKHVVTVTRVSEGVSQLGLVKLFQNKANAFITKIAENKAKELTAKMKKEKKAKIEEVEKDTKELPAIAESRIREIKNFMEEACIALENKLGKDLANAQTYFVHMFNNQLDNICTEIEKNALGLKEAPEVLFKNIANQLLEDLPPLIDADGNATEKSLIMDEVHSSASTLFNDPDLRLELIELFKLVYDERDGSPISVVSPPANCSTLAAQIAPVSLDNIKSTYTKEQHANRPGIAPRRFQYFGQSTN